MISSIVLESVAGGTFSIADFYVRRIKRNFPALLLMLATVFTVGWCVLYPDEHEQLGKHIAGGIGFVSNVILWPLILCLAAGSFLLNLMRVSGHPDTTCYL
jgi:peptidoglycan/LPS O-acetylase OafA/YrhL